MIQLQGWGVQLASGGQRPGMLLNILHHPQRITQPQMLSVEVEQTVLDVSAVFPIFTMTISFHSSLFLDYGNVLYLKLNGP
jgi:hypothetical protein